ncbi:MAG TPA: flagellar hook-basal body protein [Solirubrobacteraceae bacterium]|nr:flagellar hook-basal body protein [Solirubrobacteraceae bacterium]
MDAGLFIAASGMVAEQARQDQLSNDLANASTPGFKPDETPQRSFGEVLLSNTSSGGPVGSIATGVSLGQTHTDLTPAGMQTTEHPLDFGIVGQGFFAVRTPQGVRYTRNGQFTVSAQGLLTDGAGHDVLDQAGRTIKVGARETVPPSTLGVFNVPNAAKQGENLYSGTPAGRASGVVRSGVLEESGASPAKVMVEMIGSLRSFQSGQQAIQAIDQTLGEAATQVGSVSGS